MFARRNVRASQFRFDHGRRSLYALLRSDHPVRHALFSSFSYNFIWETENEREGQSSNTHGATTRNRLCVKLHSTYCLGRRLIKCVDCSFSRTSSFHKRVSELTIQPSTDRVYIYTETKTALIVHLGEAADFHVTARLVHMPEIFKPSVNNRGKPGKETTQPYRIMEDICRPSEG